MRGDLVGARCAANPQVDAPRMKRLEHPELLGNDQRLMVRKHHAPEPTRNVVVTLARCAISTGGAELAIPGML